jgi:vanillate monooxygenase ferredoxin subunit
MAQLMRMVKVNAKTAEADSITSFELIAMEGEPLLPFSAGSHIDVEIKPGLIRQYSLCNDPQERSRYLIGVLRERESRGGSIALVEGVSIGDVIKVGEPRNNFALQQTAKRAILLAGGIGVTPILCMAEQLANCGTPFEMHYCTRSKKRAAFHARIIESRFADSVQFYFADEGRRVDLDRILGKPEAGHHLYVCGPNGFIDVVLEKARLAGWPANAVHREFFTAAENSARYREKPFVIEISGTGRRLRVDPDKSVAEVLSASGFDISISCAQGICGTCITRVIRGIPDHRDMILTDDEKARNDQFAPCCSRSMSDVLVIDL